MRRLLPVAAAVVVLLFSGLVHGVWTDRWAAAPDLNEAVARMDALPLQLGDWEGEALPGKGRPNGGLAGALARRYVHRASGRAVTVFLGCGRPGPVSIHTPDVCYAASGFEVDTPKEFLLPNDSAARGAIFYTSRLVKTKAADKTELRIFWSWNAGGKWQVAENPRFAFVREQVLYKLYLLREAGTGANPGPADAEPCLELMNVLLPALDRALMDRS